MGQQTQARTEVREKGVRGNMVRAVFSRHLRSSLANHRAASYVTGDRGDL